MAEKAQFDIFLGGSQELPPEAHIMKLASARANEIAAMTYSIDNPQQTKLIFQKLPMHMRRRIMSHNAKRMPRRLREMHIHQMSKSGLPPKTKRPSRKYRRRPQNLIAEYKRRQVKNAWLETHVWHAKRFHMVEKWGHRLPEHSNDRSFRASYRAVAKHCLLQDISYYSCIQLTGPINALKKMLKNHCDPGNLSFTAKSYIQGSREGNLMFYRKNGYPTSPVGTVEFIWRPGNSELKTLWMWAHPAFYQLILSEICNSFKFNLESPCHSSDSEYSGADNCRLVLLKNSLNRFRLCGPLSLAVLTTALRLPEIGKILDEVRKSEGEGDEVKSHTTMETDSPKCGDSDSDVEIVQVSKKEIEPMDVESNTRIDRDDNNESLETTARSWYSEYYRDSENIQSLQVQKEVFEHLRDLNSPNQLPPCAVMAFTVLDPRYFVPTKRNKAQTNARTIETIPVPPTLINVSAIWEPRIRKSSVKNFKTTNEINKLRSENLVPGIGNDDKYDQSYIAKVPILLIQRPGCGYGEKSLGFSSGIDVILPSGWATPFWISFIFRCAKPGGLRESTSIIFENLRLNSPDFNPPDTEAYIKEASERKTSLMEKYFRYPPNRRSNYVKLGISSPFYCEWNLLIKEWTDMATFYVLRDKKLLHLIQENISHQLPLNRHKKYQQLCESSFDKTVFKDTNTLITVKIVIESKGCPRDFAIICLPLSEDLEKLGQKRTWEGPVAKLRKDPNESIRKTLRRGHLALLKRLRRQRVKQRIKMESSDHRSVEPKPSSSIAMSKIISRKKAQSIVDLQAEKMKNLYLPNCKTIRNSCDREVMGYVVKGDFSFTESKGIGLGYVTLPSLFSLIKQKSNVVLIRNTRSRQYRLARLSILT
ncbi:ribonucleases P/MRP protein subunit POP1 [Neodiprion lecontei]|uniref:Ribonucleases P/MRP protein subunit POP1 n=1 Tax=Neodiprion lecontei TaxID=441921 RepID=A0A6J0BUK5_NEOLC|nr:ribonucleases P/MRP protein subunit POP1 [Neodiprion lecontei]